MDWPLGTVAARKVNMQKNFVVLDSQELSQRWAAGLCSSVKQPCGGVAMFNTSFEMRQTAKRSCYCSRKFPFLCPFCP